jgi:hypothetical protein
MQNPKKLNPKETDIKSKRKKEKKYYRQVA